MFRIPAYALMLSLLAHAPSYADPPPGETCQQCLDRLRTECSARSSCGMWLDEATGEYRVVIQPEWISDAVYCRGGYSCRTSLDPNCAHNGYDCWAQPAFCGGKVVGTPLSLNEPGRTCYAAGNIWICHVHDTGGSSSGFLAGCGPYEDCFQQCLNSGPPRPGQFCGSGKMPYAEFAPAEGEDTRYRDLCVAGAPVRQQDFDQQTGQTKADDIVPVPPASGNASGI